MERTWWLAVAVLVAGCGKSEEKGGKATGEPRADTIAAGDPDGCEAFGARTTINANAQIADDALPALRAQLQQMSAEIGRILTLHCMDDRWSGDAIACGRTARDPQLECFAKLDAGQERKVRAEIQEATVRILSAP